MFNSHRTVTSELVIEFLQSCYGLSPTSVSLAMGGAINHTYFVTFHDGKELVLRVSNSYYVRKTEYEVAAMKLASDLGIPVPQVVAYDQTTKNGLNHEYLILEKTPGISLGRIIEKIPLDDVRQIMAEVVGLCKPMWNRRFDAIGQLSTERRPSPLADGLHGPFLKFKDFCIGDLEVYIRELARIEDKEFIDRVKEYKWNLEKNGVFNGRENDVFVMTHCDLTCGNILVDPMTHRVTGILDWEWSQAGPIELEMANCDFYDKPELRDDFVNLVSEAVSFDVRTGLNRKQPIRVLCGLEKLCEYKQWAEVLHWSAKETRDFEVKLHDDLNHALAQFTAE